MIDIDAASDFAAALLDPERPLPPGLKTCNGSDPARRLAVYRNNVVASLIDALANGFPVTQALVGEEFFRAMARIYVAGSPPASPLMMDYGRSFPDFIATFAPAASVPYLADVARLERLRVDAYHAADATPLAADAFRPLLADPGRLLALRLELHPACRWLRSRHSIFSLWAAHQGAGDLRDVDPSRAEAALVVRPEVEVRVLSLPPGGADFLDALGDGQTLAEAASRGIAANPAFDLAANLAGLIEQGLAIGFIQPDKDPP